MYVSKRYKILMSKQLSNGTIVSMEFSSELGEEGADPEVLFEQVKQDVKNDLKKSVKTDPLAKVIWNSVVDGVKQEERLNGDSD